MKTTLKLVKYQVTTTFVSGEDEAAGGGAEGGDGADPAGDPPAPALQRGQRQRLGQVEQGGEQKNQCCGSMTFWGGSGSGSAYPCL
jgi:hypothetical protein